MLNRWLLREWRSRKLLLAVLGDCCYTSQDEVTCLNMVGGGDLFLSLPRYNSDGVQRYRQTSEFGTKLCLFVALNGFNV